MLRCLNLDKEVRCLGSFNYVVSLGGRLSGGWRVDFFVMSEEIRYGAQVVSLTST